VGGGFGTKIMLFFPEEILVPHAAMTLGRPVKWTEDRREHLIAANQERGQIHEVEVGIDETGRILALRDHFVHDTGAYTPYGIVVPIITSTQLPGPYRLKNYTVEFEVAYTNKVAVSPYRGAGRPHGVFVMERVIGLIAGELGLEPAEVRRRNFVQADEFPWDVGLTFQDGAPTRYDSGNYPAGLAMAIDMIGAADFRRHQTEARRAGRYLGLGLGCYVEGTGIGPYEGAHVRVEPSGKVLVATGLTTQGQGRAQAREAAGGPGPPRGRGTGARGAWLLRAAAGDVRQRLPRRDHRGGPRDREPHVSPLRRPARLWHAGEPDDRRGANPRGRRAGRRRLVLRAHRLRWRRPAAHHDLHGLPDADRAGSPRDRDRPHADAVAAERARDQ